MRTNKHSRKIFPRVSHGRPNLHGLCHEHWMFIFRFDGRRFLPVGAKQGRSRSFGIPGSVLWAQQAAEQRGTIGLPRPCRETCTPMRDRPAPPEASRPAKILLHGVKSMPLTEVDCILQLAVDSGSRANRWVRPKSGAAPREALATVAGDLSPQAFGRLARQATPAPGPVNSDPRKIGQHVPAPPRRSLSLPRTEIRALDTVDGAASCSALARPSVQGSLHDRGSSGSCNES